VLTYATDFEVVQEDAALSPDSLELAHYEEYCRRELPRDFRAALEEVVRNESQPIEESIRNQLTNIIQDCQDRVFSRYRSSSAAAATWTPLGNPTSLHSPESHMPDFPESTTNNSMAANSPSQVSFRRSPPPFFQPPSPQTHLQSRLEVSDLQSARCKDPSDSGYSSNFPDPPSEPSSLIQHETASLSSFQSYATFEPVQDHTQPVLETENCLINDGKGIDSPGSFEIITFGSSWWYDLELQEGSE
jgi:hypothetical protein